MSLKSKIISILVILSLSIQTGYCFEFNLFKKKNKKQDKVETVITPEEKELWLLFDRVYVTELLARDEFAKGAYMLGAEDRETMLR